MEPTKTALLVAQGSRRPQDVHWSFVTCDVYDVGWPSGDFTKVLAFVDQFSRGVLCIPLEATHTSEDIADSIIYVLMRFYGKPIAIRSDRGSVLISEVIAQLYSKHTIRMEDGTAYHHATAGVVERFFGVLRHMLLTHRAASKDDQWHLYLPLLEMAYNDTVNDTTGLAPFFVNHLRHSDLALDVLTGRPHRGPDALKPYIAEHLERMVLIWEVLTRQLNLQSLHGKMLQDTKRETNITYAPGQQVILVKGHFVDGNLPKIEDPTDGPFTILKSLPRGNYVLGDLRSRRMHEVINEERLMPWPSRRINSDDALGQRYTVQRIVDRKSYTDENGEAAYKYRVRWAGWHKKSDSWRTMDSLQEVAPLVAAFNRLKPLDDITSSMHLAESIGETPPVDPAVASLPHFRALDGGAQQSAAPAVALDAQFPVGSVVEMLYKNDDGSLQWYEGSITRSALSLSPKGEPDLSYTIRFLNEPRSRSYKLSRNSLRLKDDPSPPPSPPSTSIAPARTCSSVFVSTLVSVVTSPTAFALRCARLASSLLSVRTSVPSPSPPPSPPPLDSDGHRWFKLPQRSHGSDVASALIVLSSPEFESWMRGHSFQPPMLSRALEATYTFDMEHYTRVYAGRVGLSANRPREWDKVPSEYRDALLSVTQVLRSRSHPLGHELEILSLQLTYMYPHSSREMHVDPRDQGDVIATTTLSGSGYVALEGVTSCDGTPLATANDALQGPGDSYSMYGAMRWPDCRHAVTSGEYGRLSVTVRLVWSQSMGSECY
jgi:hypothetical protein